MGTIDCFLIKTDGTLKTATMTEDFLVELSVSLRNKGIETIQFKDSEIEVEGVYIPAKGSKIKLMVLPDIEG